MVTCSLCFARGLPVKLNVCDYIKHIRLFHACQPNFKFMCGIDGCLRSYSNVGTFKNHVSAVHCDTSPSATCTPCDSDSVSLPDEPHSSSSDTVNVLGDTFNDSDTSDSDHNEEHTSEEDRTCFPNCSRDTLQKSAALFLLGLKEKHKLTQVAVQEIVEGVTILTQQQISILRSQVCV